MFRPWRLLALSCLLAPACAGEEFTSTEASNSSNFTGASGSVGTGGTDARGGAGLGGAQSASQGGTKSEPRAGAAGEPATSGGEPGAGGEPSTDGGASTGGSNTSTAGAGNTGGSSTSGGSGGDACPLGMLGPTCSDRIHACRELPERTPNGTYRIDPDGTGPIAAFDASCLFDASGGWTLILNYVHKGGTNPALAARKDSLPLLGSDALGVDESALTKNWGHAATTLLAALAPQALRFQGRISAHERVVDFTTSDHDCLAYVIGGSTNCKALATNSTLLSTHTATLPRIATAFMSGKGDLALTEFPFYLGGQAHWAIKGETQRWEVDNTPVAGVIKYFYDTVHRVWMR